MLTLWKESYDQSRQHIKKQRHYFAKKGLSSQGYGFPSGHIWMWELECEESWAPKNWCFWTVVLEKTLEIPLDCKEIQPVHPKGDQSCVFNGRTDVEAETPSLWPPDAKSWLIWKDPNAVKDWEQEEKGMTEDEMVRWHHRLNGPEFSWIPGLGDGQGCLACCSSWGHKESDTTEQLNWTELNWLVRRLALTSHAFVNIIYYRIIINIFINCGSIFKYNLCIYHKYFPVKTNLSAKKMNICDHLSQNKPVRPWVLELVCCFYSFGYYFIILSF